MALSFRTRRFTFRSVHALLSGPRREQRHGHEYHVEVTATGLPKDVENLVQEKILSRLDRRDLTGLIEPATGEIIVEWIHRELDHPSCGLIAVALQETRKNRFISSRSDRRYVG